MKGILLAGGAGTRLYPITKGVCKQLLPIYDKPLIYYPLSVLMLAGIRDILVISTPHDLPRFQELLGTGEDLGVKFSYKQQNEPRGIAEAFIIAEEFIGADNVALILGDNIFYGEGLTEILQDAVHKAKSVVFGYYVRDPKRYGVMEFDAQHRVLSVEEKPQQPKSNWAVTGLYLFDHQVVGIAKNIKPSARGELEITDVINEYLKRGRLEAKLLGRGYAWLDTGTHESLIDAGMFIKTIEERQGLKIGCIEEAAFRMGYIDKGQVSQLAARMRNDYGKYLEALAGKADNGFSI
ncbi:MAG: glucose-1-phosphate thymidylyltransferase RfbA [Candidatus Omnitrophota bacterium]